MQIHVPVSQQSHIQTSNYGLKRSWSKDDITMSSNVYFVSSDIFKYFLFFCLQKFLIFKCYITRFGHMKDKRGDLSCSST